MVVKATFCVWKNAAMAFVPLEWEYGQVDRVFFFKKLFVLDVFNIPDEEQLRTKAKLLFFLDTSGFDIEPILMLPSEEAGNPPIIYCNFFPNLAPSNFADGAIKFSGCLNIRHILRKRRFCVLVGNHLYIYDDKKKPVLTDVSPRVVIKVEGVGPWGGVHWVNPLERPHEIGFEIRFRFHVYVDELDDMLDSNYPRPLTESHLYVLAENSYQRDLWLKHITASVEESRKQHELTASADLSFTDSQEGGHRMGSPNSHILFSPADFKNALRSSVSTEMNDKRFTENRDIPIFENQRFNGHFGWGSRRPQNLLYTERGKYSDESGNISTMRFDLQNYEVDKNSFPCDEDGWEYAFSFLNFNSKHWYSSQDRSKEKAISFVRRRLWKPIKKSSKHEENTDNSAKAKKYFKNTEKARSYSMDESSLNYFNLHPPAKYQKIYLTKKRSVVDYDNRRSSRSSTIGSHSSRFYLAKSKQHCKDDLQPALSKSVWNNGDNCSSSSNSSVDNSVEVSTILDWYSERILRKYIEVAGWRNSKNIFSRLRKIVEEAQREIVQENYSYRHENELDEILEDYKKQRNSIWSIRQNGIWVLKPLLISLFKRYLEEYQPPSVCWGNSRSSDLSIPAVFAQKYVDKELIPKLNIVMLVVGSRGDVQPFVAYGVYLKEQFGHHIRIAAHACFKEFVTSYGLEFHALPGSPEMLISSLVKHALLSIPMAVDHLKVKRPWIKELLVSAYDACVKNYLVDEKCDAIIANPPSFAGPHIAEKLQIPIHMVFTMPWTPTKAIPSPFMLTHLNTDESNYFSYRMVDRVTWLGTKDLINNFRKEKLGLDYLEHGDRILNNKCVPFTYCFSEFLLPKPKDWPPWIDVSGFWFLKNKGRNTNEKDLPKKEEEYTPSIQLKSFLEVKDSSPPIFIGFGSMCVDNVDKLSQVILDGIIASGERAVIQRGLAGLDFPAKYSIDKVNGLKDSVFFIDSVPHDWLFPYCKAVVHHGGAGTTAAGLSAGKPSILIPFFGDQFFWAEVVSRMGAGPEVVPYSKLTAKSFKKSIEFVCTENILKKAKGVGEKIRQEDGVVKAATSFHRFLPLSILTCDLHPNHSVGCVYNKTLGIQLCKSCYLNDEYLNHEMYEYKYMDWNNEFPWSNPKRLLGRKIDTSSGSRLGE